MFLRKERDFEMSHQETNTPAAKPVLLALLAVFIIYGLLCAAGLPQKWTADSLGGHHDEPAAEAVESAEPAAEAIAEPAAEGAEAEPAASAAEGAEAEPAEEVEHAEHADHAGHAAVVAPEMWTIIPFCVLLLCIAVLPLIPATEHWWESNKNRFIVAAILGAIILAYYAFVHPSPVACHWPSHSVADSAAGKAGAVFINAIVGEYIAFIVLLFSLFTISGGIRISGDLKASPLVNSVILFIGAALASFVGTTGAAMLLIRLLLDTNKERKYKVHTVIFFIFCVCNCGGCLLPIGDPPLFLGYLRGVGFLWTFSLWKEWLFVNAIVIGVYFLWDSLWFYRRETELAKLEDRLERQPLRIQGLCPNLFCLLGVIAAVALLDPGKAIGGWHPWMFLREIVQLLMVALSLSFGSFEIRRQNSFNYAAIIEVAALFFGIFICMQSPLAILNEKGGEIAEKASEVGKKIGLDEAQMFFWMTGSLSSVLDNAPTYVVFFETAKSAANAEAKENPEIAAEMVEAKKVCGVEIPLALLAAVSLGAVFMGSMTYIGNGPNFMVKAIAEQSGVKMPSFFGYMAYSICLLLPVLIAMTLIFLR